MKCPLDNTELVMSERQGIEIDYCPSCRGVWLDRGELDKIIDRSTIGQSMNAESSRSEQQEYSSKHSSDEKPYGRRKKKESFLSDLFDFD